MSSGDSTYQPKFPFKSYEWLEREAIKEFCGNMSHEEAVRQTRREFYGRKD